MSDIVSLIKEKNIFLEKFKQLNLSEIENITSGNFDRLDQFYLDREGILEVIKKLDEKIECQDLAFVDENSEIEKKTEILLALDKRNELVKTILEQDLEILSAIEVEKSKIIKDLAQTRVSKKAIGAYHSGLKDSNASVDEEA